MEQVGQFIGDILLTFLKKLHINFWCKNKYTAVSRKVVGKSERDNPEGYCGWFWAHCFSKKFERMAREAMEICLQVLKESNKSRFDDDSVRNGVSVTSYITFRDCSMFLFFSDNLLEVAVYLMWPVSMICLRFTGNQKKKFQQL